MTEKKEANIIFREAKSVRQAIDQSAEESGGSRSSFIRAAIRAKLKAEADSQK